MKKIKNQNQLFLGLLLLLALFAGTMNAQMSGSTYSIQNNRNCDVAVHYEVSDCANNIVCNSIYQVIPGSGGVFSLAGSCVAPSYDIFVWLLEIDYVDVTGGNNNGSVAGGLCMTSGQGNTATGSKAPASCLPVSWSMIWSLTDVQIN